VPSISALDENGRPVDWWFVYKVPKLGAYGARAATTGYEYAYYDARTGAVAKSTNLLNDGKGAVDLTLRAFFHEPAETTGWILYNDEMPADVTSIKNNGRLGHTKGVIAFDTASKTALWLLHSWPKYADQKSTELPTPEYGQTFLCLSLHLDTASRIALQMTTNQEPQVYEKRLPTTLDTSDPLRLLTEKVEPDDIADSSVVDVTTRAGLAFKVIAKNRNWGKDFWNDLVGPTLKSDMDIETWLRGPAPSKFDSDGVHWTEDVKFIDLRPLGIPYTWPETSDHAKWGLAVQRDWICVGDINRMISQEKRGGGTVAFQDHALWSALKQTDLVKPPPGYSKADAMALIKATHTRSRPAEPPTSG
jgi:deoxyribonuclease-2